MPGDNDGSKLTEHINKQKAIFLSIECITSNIPPRIVQSFRDLEHVMCMKPYTFRAIQYEPFYYALWKLFRKRTLCYSNFNVWPCRIPDIDMGNTSVLGTMIEEEYEKYSLGLEEATKKRNSLMYCNG